MDSNGDSNDDLELDAQRERILIGGAPGTGKSYSLLALADYIQIRDPDAKIFILDADRGMGKVRKSEWPQVNNIAKHYVARNWEVVEQFLAEVGEEHRPKDWVFIDMLGRFWDMAQSLEVSAVHGVSPGQAMLNARKNLVEQHKLHAPGSLPQPDWTVIKRFHNDEFIDTISNVWDAHVVATTALNKLDVDRDDALLVEIFAPYGYRPEGEKYNVHRFDTVMFMSLEGDKRYISTVKDRGRHLVKHLLFENLWDTYSESLKKNKQIFADSLS
jgi:hypothetical protein